MVNDIAVRLVACAVILVTVRGVYAMQDDLPPKSEWADPSLYEYVSSVKSDLYFSGDLYAEGWRIDEVTTNGHHFDANELLQMPKIATVRRVILRDWPELSNETIRFVLQFPELTEFHLLGSDVTDEGLAILNQLQKLKNVHLFKSRCDGAVLSHLISSPAMERIILQGPLNWDCLKDIQVPNDIECEVLLHGVSAGDDEAEMLMAKNISLRLDGAEGLKVTDKFLYKYRDRYNATLCEANSITPLGRMRAFIDSQSGQNTYRGALAGHGGRLAWNGDRSGVRLEYSGETEYDRWLEIQMEDVWKNRNQFPQGWIKELRIADRFITTKEVRQICCHPRLELETLEIVDTPLKDKALDAIARLPQLRRLVLDKNAITDTGLAKLATLTKLEHLSLRETQVTPQGIAEFLHKTAGRVAVEY